MPGSPRNGDTAVRVVLTGGIATGKSTVARALVDAGLPVVDADQLARDVVAPGTPGLAAVVGRFGPDVLAPSGVLDRAALGRRVFADRTAREALERIIHPLVRAGIARFFEALPPGAVGVAEVPLAFETGWAASFDLSVAVVCRPETQRQRLLARDHLTPDEAARRLAAQWPIEDKAWLADAVVVTEGAMARTLAQAARLAAWLRGRSRPW